MKIAVGDVRKPFARDDREEIPAAPDLPQIDQFSDDLAAIPEIESVRIELAHLVRMARHRHGAAGTDLLDHLEGIAIGREELVEPECQHMNRRVPVDRVASHLGAGNHQQAVGVRSAARFDLDLILSSPVLARRVFTVRIAIVALSLYLHSAAALIYWLVPAILGQPFLRLFLLAEHTGCAFDADMLANTRTTYTNPAVLLLTWRMPYHAEHHSFPSVPFHALVTVNALLPSAGRVTSRGYVAWHRALLRQLRAAAR